MGASDLQYSVIKIPLILTYLQGSVYEKKRPDLEINAAEKNKFWAEREVSMSVIFFEPFTSQCRKMVRHTLKILHYLLEHF